MIEERIQKILARAGIASRRAAEDLIRAGRVTVNGTVAELGARADAARDTIRVDGRAVAQQESAAYLMLNKPSGYVCTRSDPQGRPTVYELVPAIPGLFTVGRLDLDTEGLLLLTSDGDWAERLSHPRNGIEREYEVHVRGPVAPGAIEALLEGTEVEGRHAAPIAAFESGREGFASVLTVVMVEGRRREVRLLCAAAGIGVRRLVRRRYGALRLGWLAEGNWRELDAREVAAVFNARATRSSSRRSDEVQDLPIRGKQRSSNFDRTDSHYDRRPGSFR